MPQDIRRDNMSALGELLQNWRQEHLSSNKQDFETSCADIWRQVCRDKLGLQSESVHLSHYDAEQQSLHLIVADHFLLCDLRLQEKQLLPEINSRLESKGLASLERLCFVLRKK